MKTFYKSLLPLLAGLAALAGCKKEVATYAVPQAEPGFFSLGVLAVAPTGTSFSTTANTKYAPGETLPLTALYNAPDGPATITVFQATRTDSAQVGSYPVSGAFNQALLATAAPVPYTVPTTYANGTAVRVDVTLTFADGSQRRRRLTYNVASSPTLAFGSPAATYRNGLAATAQSEGDIIGYALVLNAGGISTLPTPPATTTSPLFKNVDSLVYYARVGTSGPLLRQGVVRNPTAGVANSRTIDVRVPAGSRGTGATFVFTAYAQTTSTSLTTPLLAVGGPTALATTRQGRVSFGGTLPADSASFNLVAGLNEPTASPVTAKDLQLTGVSPTGVVTLGTPSATRYYKLTVTQLNALPYATATANAVGNLLYQNLTANTADLGTPTAGDVYAVRLRSATGSVVLLRILSVRASSGTTGGRLVRFEYRSL